MSLFRDFFKRKNIVVMVAYGGLGEFLFQLDCAARLREADGETKTLFLVRGKYTLFSQILQAGNVSFCRLYDARGWRYPLVAAYFLFLRPAAIINSFHSLYYRFPTRVLYGTFALFGTRIIVAKHARTPLPYEQVIYEDKETIWKRNNRIASAYAGKSVALPFPLLAFSFPAYAHSGYVHIHPVGSVPQKSYPVRKLIELLSLMPSDKSIVVTMTPNEERWYVTDELRECMRKRPNISFISKSFSFEEIGSIMTSSAMFCTVSTGLVWVAAVAGQRTVVLDYFTDYEWNPAPYPSMIRLSHDYTESGESLHQVLAEHEDGRFFESMYRISPREAREALLGS